MVKIIEEFKARFRIALVMTGTKASELSKKTGISEATLSQYLSGYSKPKDERLALLATALGVDPAWLKGFDVPMRRNDYGLNDMNYALLLTAEKLGMDDLKEMTLSTSDAEKKELSEEFEMLTKYRSLNDTGKEKARDYVSDLAEQKKYTEKDTGSSEDQAG